MVEPVILATAALAMLQPAVEQLVQKSAEGFARPVRPKRPTLVGGSDRVRQTRDLALHGGGGAGTGLGG